MNIFTAIDGDTMEIAWQVMVSGNLDNTDCDYQGKYAFSTSYNSEMGMNLAEMTENELDHVVVFNLKGIEERLPPGTTRAERRQRSSTAAKRPSGNLTRYIPIPNSPARCERRARQEAHHDQRQAVADSFGD